MLALNAVSHQYGTLHVLDNVSFEVAAGEVHALLGENGAGKTSLMLAAYGMLRPDSGEVIVGTSTQAKHFPRGFASPAEARDVGIGMVHQHFTSIPAFSAADNIALAGNWRETGRAAQSRAQQLIDRVGLPVDVSARVDTLSVGMRQRLEILKALASDARVLLLDEPTAVLAPREVADLQAALRTFVAGGGSVVLITHKLPEVFAMADQVTVLRRGRVVMTGQVRTESASSLASAMLGEEQKSNHAESRSRGGGIHRNSEPRTVVRAFDLSLVRAGSKNTHSIAAIRSATFDCRTGEITGVVAIEGNGQRELLRAIAGVDDVQRIGGRLEVTGKVAFIPDDRLGEALIPSFTLTENVLLGTLENQRWIDWNAMKARTAELLQRYDVRAQGVDQPVRTLSGGNQQKLVFGRAMLLKPNILIAEQPTRGLDLRATAAIHARLREAADSGMAVIVYASDLDEVVGIADRLLVVANGQVREMSPDADRETIGDAMLGITR